MSFSVSNPNGTFSTSTPSTFTVTTDNYTGYTLSIASTTTDESYSKLINTDNPLDLEHAINSISSPSNEQEFNRNNWGYLLNRIDTTNNNTIDNTLLNNSLDNNKYQPAPTKVGTTLDITDQANTDPNTYSITLGIKADYSTPLGTYANTYILIATANPSNYTITYNKNTPDSEEVTNMPETQSGDTTATEISLSPNTPERDNYTFTGWCDIEPTSSDSCQGNTYQPSDTIELDQTTSNDFTFYALWTPLAMTFNRAFADANKTPITINNKQYYKMQDMDAFICNSVDYNQQAQLVDIRDNKLYWVLKANDNHCWMTQNLDLNLSSSTTYTPADTDVTSNWTPTRSTIPSSNITNGNISGWTNDHNTPYSIDVGNWYWNNTWYDSTTDCPSTSGNNYAGCNYLTGNANGKFAKNTPYSTNGEHGHVGNYYNWSAAVAMNDTSSYTTSTYDNVANNPQTSICPAGWRLPTTSSVASRNEFANLLTAYGSGTSDDKILVASPLYFVRGGFSHSGVFYYAGYNGIYWSSTVYSFKYSYYLSFDSVVVYPAYGDLKYGARSVRCIAREPVMQEVSTWEDKLATDESIPVVDKRDGKIYTVAKIGDLIWMTKNLDIAGKTTLTPTTSNVSSNYTLPASTINGFSGNTGSYVYNDSVYGGYYSYAAATAGTDPSSGEATSDICPKGWKLPTSNNFSTLMQRYTTANALIATPWNGAVGGYYYNGASVSRNVGGYYMSSTVNTSTSVYIFNFGITNNNVLIRKSDVKSGGISVRCIVR